MNEDAVRVQTASYSAIVEAGLIRHLLPSFIMQTLFAAYFFTTSKTINYKLCHVIK